ncbi:MAG: TlpA family protein disulfide reductase [Pyrinomonadaceae bacterium]
MGCASCRAHKPKLNELKSKFGSSDDVVFLAVTADDADAVRKYLAKEPFDYLQAADAQAELDRFRFSGYPRNIVVGRTGEIVYWRSSISAWDKFESVIRGELAK